MYVPSIDGELGVRVEDLEVRMMRMENIQHEILARVRTIEESLLQPHSQQYQTHLPTDHYMQPYHYPTSHSSSPCQPQVQHSHLQQDQNSYSGFNFGYTSGVHPSPSSEPPTYPQQSPQSNLHNSSDPGWGSNVVENILPCRIPLPSNASAVLPSSEINKKSLRTVQEVLQQNTKLWNESSAGTLSQRLAKDAIFGREVMRKCTPNGTREYPALPREELYELKTTLFRQFPKFHKCPANFEALWKKCMTSIEQACKRLRSH